MPGEISDEDRARAEDVREELKNQGLGDEIPPRGSDVQAPSGDPRESSGWFGRRTPPRNSEQ